MCDCEKRIDALSEAMNLMSDMVIHSEEVVYQLLDRVAVLEADTTTENTEGPKIGPLSHDGIEELDDANSWPRPVTGGVDPRDSRI